MSVSLDIGTLIVYLISCLRVIIVDFLRRLTAIASRNKLLQKLIIRLQKHGNMYFYMYILLQMTTICLNRAVRLNCLGIANSRPSKIKGGTILTKISDKALN